MSGGLDRWREANQRYLTAALARVREAVERRGDRPESAGAADDALAAAGAGMETPPALEVLCETFGLSAFERSVLLLCAGVELDSSFAGAVAAAAGEGSGRHPSFGLALAALPDAHWSALSPAGPLRHWRLVDLESGASPTAGRLRIDERILHYLTGLQHLDERLAGLVHPAEPAGALVPSLERIADEVAALWSRSAGEVRLPAVQLCGESSSARAVAAAAAARLGLDLAVLPASAVPASPAELDGLARLWEREAALGGAALLLDCHGPTGEDAGREAALGRLLERLRSPLLLAGRERLQAALRSLVTFDLPRPTAAEQRSLWESALGSAAARLDGHVDDLVAQFDLTAPAIATAGARALGGEDAEASAESASLDGGGELARRLWRACRIQARPRLDDLAQRIRAVAGWEDLVVPRHQERVLREAVLHVRHRRTVYETWGFERKSSRGLGIGALFAGPSGTGKTMAAEVLARELDLDLYRIDLSAVVSKYIGETEKNLARVFDAAEAGGAILLFDEADALFGKRSEVKDSHDRYANIEVSYLLQRMESYRGLSILTSNLKDALDTAFLRRLRFIVQFPFPDAVLRAEIWRRVFPAETPTEGLDPERLARLNVPGGNIRNIALGAAFLAADEGAPVGMGHLLRAARTEYAKIEKSLSDAEVRGWPG
ncbi:MAG TPA: AAA family ATPase [Thermoanaerobaculia bacterium]|nr:AAA family ATPase [Thermoanaerobaculia bacterium]